MMPAVASLHFHLFAIQSNRFKAEYCYVKAQAAARLSQSGGRMNQHLDYLRQRAKERSAVQLIAIGDIYEKRLRAGNPPVRRFRVLYRKPDRHFIDSN
jgi:hypothetical protein